MRGSHGFARHAAVRLCDEQADTISIDYYAETNEPHCRTRTDVIADDILSALSLVVWTLKREVRAFGGCLGMHRR
jgi:hypothetical protein